MCYLFAYIATVLNCLHRYKRCAPSEGKFGVCCSKGATFVNVECLHVRHEGTLRKWNEVV